MIGGLVIHDAHALWRRIQLKVAGMEEGRATSIFDASAIWRRLETRLVAISDKKGANVRMVSGFVVFVSFISRRSSARETVHCGLFSRGDFNALSLRVFQFALKFSSRSSSSWTVLKGTNVFLLLCLSFRGEVLLAKQFVVDCTQEKT